MSCYFGFVFGRVFLSRFCRVFLTDRHSLLIVIVTGSKTQADLEFIWGGTEAGLPTVQTHDILSEIMFYIGNKNVAL